MATRQKLTSETLWAFATKIGAAVFYYALILFLTRRMSVDAWGAWSAFFALLNIVLLVSDQGINVALKRYVAAARETRELAGVVRSTFVLRVISNLVFVVVFAAIGPLLLRWVGQGEYVDWMQRSLVLVGLYGVMEYFKSLFEALHQLRATFAVTITEHFLKLICVAWLFAQGDPFHAIINGFTFAVVVALALGLTLTSLRFPNLIKTSAPRGLKREAWRYSAPVFLMSIAGFISLEIDTIMLKALRGDYETGIYAAAKQIVMFLPHIALIFSMGTIPGLAVFEDAEAAAKRRNTYYRVLKLLAVIYLGVALGLVAVALGGLKWLFPPQYATASAPLLALIPFTLFNAVTVYSGNLMVYRGLAWQRSLNVIITVCANVILNLWLIPRWGATGAAAASSLAYLPYCLLNLRAAHGAFAGSATLEVADDRITHP
jgi:O-antigen/teichoic acid export membrane protein